MTNVVVYTFHCDNKYSRCINQNVVGTNSKFGGINSKFARDKFKTFSYKNLNTN